MASMHAASAPVRAARTPAGDPAGAGMSFAKVLARSFAPRRLQQLRPRVQQLCDDLLDELAAQTPPVDFHEAVSFPLPAAPAVRQEGDR